MGLMARWNNVKDDEPDKTEPVVYAKRDPINRNKWKVGIAYWTKSQKWNPELNSKMAPEGFTHWMPLPPPPSMF